MSHLVFLQLLLQEQLNPPQFQLALLMQVRLLRKHLLMKLPFRNQLLNQHSIHPENESKLFKEKY